MLKYQCLYVCWENLCRRTGVALACWAQPGGLPGFQRALYLVRQQTRSVSRRGMELDVTCFAHGASTAGQIIDEVTLNPS